MSNLKVGIFGVGRGMDIAKNLMLNGATIHAVCDFRKERLEQAKDKIEKDTLIFEDFDAFLDSGVEAVVVANYFHEHAPYAIKCLQRGIHVLSECISNGTMADGVALIRAAEKSDAIYMLAENYPHMRFNREIKRICDSGTLGTIHYAEGEYNHPLAPSDIPWFNEHFRYFPEHWRYYLPATYYVTHSLAPIMAATGATPEKVIGLTINQQLPDSDKKKDITAVMMTQNNDGSVFKFLGCATFGGHGNAYRVCGSNGQIENIRGMNEEVMLRYNNWCIPEGEEEVRHYTPSWNDKDEDFIVQSGHGGGDYLCARLFMDCVRERKQPPFPYDVKSAVTMSSVAILAHRSVLAGGTPMDLPNYDHEADRAQYENDRATPFYGADGSEPNIPFTR